MLARRRPGAILCWLGEDREPVYTGSAKTGSQSVLARLQPRSRGARSGAAAPAHRRRCVTAQRGRLRLFTLSLRAVSVRRPPTGAVTPARPQPDPAEVPQQEQC